MEKNEIISPGAIYEHYKGQRYKVHQTVIHSESLEELVMYECLYENKQGQFWVRPKRMFLEKVEKEGRLVQRFKRLD